MLGWGINIWRPIDPAGTPARKRQGFIGAWTVAGTSGLKWLDDLVSTGRAVSLGGDGYPLSYRIAASELAAAVGSGPPALGPQVGVIVGEDYIARSGAVTDFEIDWDVLNACPRNEELHIEAWDLS